MHSSDSQARGQVTSADQNPSERNERTSVVAQLASVIQKVDNIIQRITHYPVDNHYQNQSSYPLDSIQLSPDIYRDAKRRGIYPPLFTDPEGDSCFSIYQIRWIKKCRLINGHNFFF